MIESTFWLVDSLTIVRWWNHHVGCLISSNPISCGLNSIISPYFMIWLDWVIWCYIKLYMFILKSPYIPFWVAIKISIYPFKQIHWIQLSPTESPARWSPRCLPRKRSAPPWAARERPRRVSPGDCGHEEISVWIGIKQIQHGDIRYSKNRDTAASCSLQKVANQLCKIADRPYGIMNCINQKGRISPAQSEDTNEK